MDCPLYMSAVEFAQFTHRPVGEVRRLCRLQCIPCEYNRKVYLIEVKTALEILAKRAADFEGHRYDFIATKRPVSVRSSAQGNQKGSKESFLASLNELVKSR